jgi:hypothetical protein
MALPTALSSEEERGFLDHTKQERWEQQLKKKTHRLVRCTFCATLYTDGATSCHYKLMFSTSS